MLSVEMHQGFATLRQEMAGMRVEWLKWSFLFWIGHVGITLGVVAYPNDPTHGSVVPWSQCQPIGIAAWDAGDPGIACRSAAPSAPPDGEELAWLEHPGATPLHVQSVLAFDEWFW